jgi:phosphatidate cytidylyltransferase
MPAWFELPVRVASGLVMGAVAIAALLWGGLLFSAFVALGAVAGLREWHRLVNAGRFAAEMIPTSAAIIAVVWLGHAPNGAALGLLAILLGAAGAALVAASRKVTVLWPMGWHAFGAVYLGLPSLALVLLRDQPRGAAIVGAIFVAVWTADTGALFFGRLVGGPKFAPILSPKKTWSGFLGGTVAAGVAEAVYVGLLHGAILEAAAFGVFIAVSGHFGDLFESWVKRQFRAKDMGRLIPGHGGMLDRIDSLLFAAPVCAALVLLMGFDPVGGGAT